ncbi:helix-turn-helix transcriptional regulator [Galbibacter sp.]|uniref:ArsR/SmtB family transcription factor n=1 Tax=Galbibacter sp. TaxID=2918471 RepID=UPI002D179272|nr:helix-turn-helix transcriptional regulator [Galbibacter sp.]HLV62366.1 helix-turn-helix transcriptional regulator [Galbibacter sp.]
MNEKHFVHLMALVCEPVRAKVLWKLLDGRAYTATELAHWVDVSPTSMSNHLLKLRKGGVLKVVRSGRYRYYSFANSQVAYAVESLANLVPAGVDEKQNSNGATTGVTYCRSCYDHLAGYVGVAITEAIVKRGFLKPSGKDFLVSAKGWEWLALIGIDKSYFLNSRRPLARQCLDWSERRPHLAGHLGAALLEKGRKNQWFKPVKFSRELIVTSKGRQELYTLLELDFQ